MKDFQCVILPIYLQHIHLQVTNNLLKQVFDNLSVIFTHLSMNFPCFLSMVHKADSARGKQTLDSRSHKHKKTIIHPLI